MNLLSMTEIQPQLARLLKKSEITPVRLGRRSEPILVVVPWVCFVTHWLKRFVALQYTRPGGPIPRVSVTQRTVTEATQAFTSYQRFLAPFLRSQTPVPQIIVIAKRTNPTVGAILSWEDWQRFASSSSPACDDERVYTIVTARKHLAQFPEQFEQEEAAGFREEVMVTQRGVPAFVIIPLALHLQQQERLEFAPIQCRICGRWVTDEEMDCHLFFSNDGRHWLGSGVFLTVANAQAIKTSLFALLDVLQQAKRVGALLDQPLLERCPLRYSGPTVCPEEILFCGEREDYFSCAFSSLARQRALREGILWLASLDGPRTQQANELTLTWLREWQELHERY